MQPQDPHANPAPNPEQNPHYQPQPEQPLTQPLPPAQPNYGAYQPQPSQPAPQAPPPQMPPSPQYQQSALSSEDQNGPQQMYYSRPLEPQKPVMSPEIQQKSAAARKKYPELNLSEGEFIVSDVKRHPIGLLGVWLVCGLIVLGIIGVAGMVIAGSQDVVAGDGIPPSAVGIVAALLSSLVLIGGYIATYVYNANKFYLTNESVIQNIQMSLFSNRQQTVSLGNVEDASYLKAGIIQTIFDFGTLRLSTQGDETTYAFTFASDPEKQVNKLNNAVEAFKNGRPVLDDDDPHFRRHH